MTNPSGVLVIGPTQQAQIKDLVRRAEASRISYAEMLKRVANPAQPGRANRTLMLELPYGYPVTFTIEEHHPGVFCRHLSVSSRRRGKVPSPEAVAMIMREFGFKNSLGHLISYFEPIGGGEDAMNLVEPLDGDMEKLRKR